MCESFLLSQSDQTLTETITSPPAEKNCKQKIFLDVQQVLEHLYCVGNRNKSGRITVKTHLHVYLGGAFQKGLTEKERSALNAGSMIPRAELDIKEGSEPCTHCRHMWLAVSSSCGHASTAVMDKHPQTESQSEPFFQLFLLGIFYSSQKSNYHAGYRHAFPAMNTFLNTKEVLSHHVCDYYCGSCCSGILGFCTGWIVIIFFLSCNFISYVFFYSIQKMLRRLNVLHSLGCIFALGYRLPTPRRSPL